MWACLGVSNAGFNVNGLLIGLKDGGFLVKVFARAYIYMREVAGCCNAYELCRFLGVYYRGSRDLKMYDDI